MFFVTHTTAELHGLRHPISLPVICCVGVAYCILIRFSLQHTTAEEHAEAGAKRPHKEEMSMEERCGLQMLMDGVLIVIGKVLRLLFFTNNPHLSWITCSI